MNEIEAARMAVGVSLACSLDLLRAHLHAGHATTEMGRDVLAAIAHPGAEFENAVFRSEPYVSVHVIEQRRAAVVGVDLAVVEWLVDRQTPARVVGHVPHLELLLADCDCVMAHIVLPSLVSSALHAPGPHALELPLHEEAAVDFRALYPVQPAVNPTPSTIASLWRYDSSRILSFCVIPMCVVSSTSSSSKPTSRISARRSSWVGRL